MSKAHDLFVMASAILSASTGKQVSQDVVEDEARKVEFIIRQLIAQHGLTDGKSVITLFLDKAYRGDFEELQPQVPRHKVDQAIESMQTFHRNLWGSACQDLGVSA